ncbi:hypothetical protein B0H19DRAFT_1081117 [Mycena capillaripes]|nr:hypothetical protein B0H19DRAFT_1081117 [Mycena capillaripes]
MGGGSALALSEWKSVSFYQIFYYNSRTQDHGRLSIHTSSKSLAVECGSQAWEEGSGARGPASLWGMRQPSVGHPSYSRAFREEECGEIGKEKRGLEGEEGGEMLRLKEVERGVEKKEGVYEERRMGKSKRKDSE